MLNNCPVLCSCLVDTVSGYDRNTTRSAFSYPHEINAGVPTYYYHVVRLVDTCTCMYLLCTWLILTTNGGGSSIKPNEFQRIQVDKQKNESVLNDNPTSLRILKYLLPVPLLRF
jgi:hypothetical protein